jgi:hypothetical protein
MIARTERDFNSFYSINPDKKPLAITPSSEYSKKKKLPERRFGNETT